MGITTALAEDGKRWSHNMVETKEPISRRNAKAKNKAKVSRCQGQGQKLGFWP